MQRNKAFFNIKSLIVTFLLFNVLSYFLPIKICQCFEDTVTIIPGSGKFIKSEPFAITRFFDIDLFPTKKIKL